MKKILVLILTFAMIFTIVSCGKKTNGQDTEMENADNSIDQNDQENSIDTDGKDENESDKTPDEDNNSEDASGDNEPNDDEASEALNILSSIWDNYPEEEKFAVSGGDYENSVMNGPGAVDFSNTENLDYMLGFPEDYAGKIDDAASLMHMMNVNTFTCGVFHVVDGEDIEDIAAAIKDNILARQWMCGFPDTLIIFNISDGFILSAFGHDEMIENFKNTILQTYSDASLLYEEAII